MDDFGDTSGIEWKENAMVEDGKLEIDWLVGWSYRRPVEIDNSAGALSDHTISIKLTQQNFNYLMAGDDGEDIRFSTLDGNKLNYWIERWDPQGESTLRVNCTDVPQGRSHILMYYGNPGAASESDGRSVFDFFDDFSGADNSRWSYTTGHSYGFDADGDRHGIWFSGDADGVCTRTTSLFNRNIVIESELNKNDRDADHFIFISPDNDATWNFGYDQNHIKFAWSSEIKYIVGQNDYSNFERPDEDIYRVRMTIGSGEVEFEDWKSDDPSDHNKLSLSDDIGDDFFIYIGADQDDSEKSFFYWLGVREYVSQEPTSSVGGEEQNPSAYITTVPISKQPDMRWSDISLTKNEPANTHIQVSVINESTNATIPGYDNRTEGIIDISDINAASIRLRVYLIGSGTNRPTLDILGVEWCRENVWRDSFTGEGKIEEHTNVNISGEIVPDDHDTMGAVKSEAISLPDENRWATCRFERSVPGNTSLNISVCDAETDSVLLTDTGISDVVDIDLSGIDLLVHPSIYLKAVLRSSSGEMPALYNWAVNWSNVKVPRLMMDVGSILIWEDEPKANILNISEYFFDDYDHIQPSIYSLKHISDTDNISVDIEGQLLGVTYLADNWTGSVSLTVECSNLYLLSTPTNEFSINVVNVNDHPVWTARPPTIIMDEDTKHVSDYSLNEYVFDADSDDLYFSISTEDENLIVELNQDNNITVTPARDYNGIVDITVGVSDADIEKKLNKTLKVFVNPVNDFPLTELSAPVDGVTLRDVNVTFSWKSFDVDDLPTNLLYDLYLGDAPSPVLHTSDIYGCNFLVTGLKDGETYYWYVLPKDDEDGGQCLNTTWSFTIDTRVPMPEVSLVFPRDGATINTTDIELCWDIFNPTGESLDYHVFLGFGRNAMNDIAALSNMTYSLSDLEDNRTYYWTVIPRTQGFKGICLDEVWSFTVNTSFTAVWDLKAAVDIERIEIFQGGNTTFNITIENNGTVPFLVEFRSVGNLTRYLTMMENLTLSPGEFKNIPVRLELSPRIRPRAYRIEIEFRFPGDAKNISIPVSINSAPAFSADGKDNELRLVEDSRFWTSLIAVLVIMIGGIYIFFNQQVLRRRRPPEEETEKVAWEEAEPGDSVVEESGELQDDEVGDDEVGGDEVGDDEVGGDEEGDDEEGGDEDGIEDELGLPKERPFYGRLATDFPHDKPSYAPKKKIKKKGRGGVSTRKKKRRGRMPKKTGSKKRVNAADGEEKTKKGEPSVKMLPPHPEDPELPPPEGEL